MVILPPEFVAIKYPGYFWNMRTEQLYSMKQTGVLRPLAKSSAWFCQLTRRWYAAGYRISHNGRRILIPLSQLERLNNKLPELQIVPVNDD